MSVKRREYLLERSYPHPRARLYAAWADPEVKIRWFDPSLRAPSQWSGDFRIGGTETYTAPAGLSPQVAYQGTYHDIVAEERLVMTVVMTVDDRRSSVTLSTVEFLSTDTGSLLRLLEQGVVLDGLESLEDRQPGVAFQLDRLRDVMATDGPPT